MDPVTTTAAVSTLSGNIKTAVDAVLKVQKATAKSSITRLTKDQIFQFPLMISSDIPEDEKFAICKNLEKSYANLILTAITNEGVINRDKYSTINEFLKNFHNNFDIPAEESMVDYIESAVAYEGYISPKELRQMDITIEQQFDCENINSMYLPFERTKAKINTALEAAKLSMALEADTYYIKRMIYTKNSSGKQVVATDKNGYPQYEYIVVKAGSAEYNNAVASGQKLYSEKEINNELETNAERMTTSQAMAKSRGEYNDKYTLQNNQQLYQDTQTAKSQKFQADQNREKREFDAEQAEKSREFQARQNKEKQKFDAEQREIEREEKRKSQKREEYTKAMGNVRGEMLRDEKYGSMMPTVLNITLANVKSQAGTWSQQLKIGIRAVPRYLSPSIMVANMCEAFKDRAIFNFIKLTKGELKWWDLLLGISESRNRAIVNTKNKWLKILKARAEKNNTSSKLGKKYNPNTTIIITENEATLIKEQCGIDPNNVKYTRKMMDKYFILGFGIYDTEAKMLKMLYDGDMNYSHISLRVMAAEAKKETNLAYDI